MAEPVRCARCGHGRRVKVDVVLDGQLIQTILWPHRRATGHDFIAADPRKE